MIRLSRLLMLSGSALILVGALILLGTALFPESTPRVVATNDLSRFQTPTPGFLGTPLAPPSGRATAEAVMILPVMPVAATATPTRRPTRRPAFTATPTLTPDASQTRPPTSTATHTPTPTATCTPTHTPTVTPTPLPLAPDRVIIPALEVEAEVQAVGWHTVDLDGQTYGQWDVPDGYAAGWHNESAPLGQAGNTVLNGHHNIEGRIFGDLIDLVPGDAITLEAGRESFHYIVAQTMVLQERYASAEDRLENARWIMPSEDERLTLVTCWPQTDNSFRLIVVAVPAEGE